MNLSAGLLHSAHELLEWVHSHPLSPRELLDSFRTVLVCPPQDVLNLCARCTWIETDADGNLKLTPRGTTIRRLRDFEPRMREQLRDFVGSEGPAWVRLLPRGRQEAVRFLHPDVAQLFREAGLMAIPASEEIIGWWDTVSGVARGASDMVLTEIGRRGERLSIAYERQRTDHEPQWQSVESNLSGFDILSVLEQGSAQPLEIEVKASTDDLDYAEFHVARNEWDTAVHARHYIFHLWLLGAKSRLARVTVDDVQSHIPLDQGGGAWETVEIPFKTFDALFTTQIC